MHRNGAIIMTFVLAAALTSLAATPVSVPQSSTFDANLEGWTLVGTVNPVPGSFIWTDDAGVHGGFVYYSDMNDDSGLIEAPARFLGDWTALNGLGSIRYDHKVIDKGCDPAYVRYEIRLSGPGAVYARWYKDVVGDPEGQWVNRIVAPIREKSAGADGFEVFDGSWAGLLSGVDRLLIRIEQIDNGPTPCLPNRLDSDGVDNVFLERSGPGNAEGLTISKIAASEVLQLQWTQGCSAGAVDYAVYEGQIGNWSSHEPATCTTGGASATQIAPQNGDRYFLVTPLASVDEGPYGVMSDGVERPRSPSACRISQNPAYCPPL